MGNHFIDLFAGIGNDERRQGFCLTFSLFMIHCSYEKER